jgi:hypothetical protein
MTRQADSCGLPVVDLIVFNSASRIVSNWDRKPELKSEAENNPHNTPHACSCNREE